ncbi:hypothetical protein GCM10011490_05410 [Pseudoclavibacter endophyticus]|uniref:ATP-binding cassette domain-containing protein n=1 Tax=Pseudoclavibacter endophyticus TaxID=1778590 RepID=A0A6H9WG79_9MICO|nr:ATP-binding cassette domain-containing protein [Pseudoclavibacter endophyticus]KAB1649959.1 ATP-binding cassette domain-containing protein [Pseudoclavibacter endophyticus]GGA58397.1 hypothetical protein GCM10011490_05410 [Pseudoclavibacter endophyticus]
MTTHEQGAAARVSPATGPTPAIVADDLSISYIEHGAGSRYEALSGATFEVGRGAILGIVGTAGSGKTALGRVLSGRGFEGRDSWPFISGGTLHVADLDLRRPSRGERRRITLDIGYLAQGSGDELRNDLTVAENIAEPILSRDRTFDKRKLGRAAALLIDAVDLELGMLGRFPFELSRGQRQRVALAAALIVEPSVLVVDEPAQGVDIIARPALFRLLERINAARQCTMVILSHDLATVQRLTNDVLVLDQGFVIARGTIDEVLSSSDHPYVQRMREAREFAQAPLPGLVDDEALQAVERVADGLFEDIDDDIEARLDAQRAEEQLARQRPEFARFQQGDTE